MERYESTERYELNDMHDLLQDILDMVNSVIDDDELTQKEHILAITNIYLAAAELLEDYGVIDYVNKSFNDLETPES